MALASGTKLGPYEIRSALGAGGMGEVYRARDTRLDRFVAIKILQSHLSCSPELKARFEREARTLSCLSHPHICSLYDVGKDGDVEFLVMELLEGETLSRRLQRGPLPISTVVKIGIEVADALAKAHRLGVIHRDLKPSNIMLTVNGAKLMDFGLAKPNVANTSAGPSLAELATATLQSPSSPLSGAGTLIGTIQYMAPEQIEGKDADVRSDIFALGSVLYEALSGRRAFEGKTHLHIASAILQRDPPAITIENPDVGLPPLEHTIRTCMAKEPDERFQTAHDVKLHLMWLARVANSQPGHGKKSFRAVWIAIAALVLALLATILFLTTELRNRSAVSAYGITRFSITLPSRQELAVNTGRAVVVSPDGRTLGYVAIENGVSHLFTRRFDQFEPVAIPDSEGASFPFFSPSGEWIAFFRQGKLEKAPTSGGVPIVIAEVPTFFGATWTPEDVIVVAIPNYGLATVSANGGSPQKVSIATNDIIYPEGPTWLAGGEWIAFTDYLTERRSVMLLKLNTGEIRVLIKNAQAPSYVRGSVVYYQGGALWAVPFDADQLTIKGNPVQVESGINEENYIDQADMSENGVLAYAPGPSGDFSRDMYLVDRKGQARKLDVPAHDYVDPAFSPDGKRIACMFRSVSGQQLAVLDRERGLFTTLAGGMGSAPAWMPDSKTILFDGVDSHQRGIFQVAADGGSAPQLVRVTGLSSHVTSIAGGYAALTVSDPATSADLWLLNINNHNDMTSFKSTPATERQGALSPDGHWLAYASNESGHSEIYVEPVPGPGGKRQISSDGGEEPRWVRNGREITYRNGTKMMSVPVQVQPTFRAGKATELFDRRFDRGFGVAGYDVASDGQTFVMTRSEHTARTEIRVVMGWSATLPHQ
jgi:serine/threonine protein kinase/Tol biopolymer transport system component